MPKPAVQASLAGRARQKSPLCVGISMLNTRSLYCSSLNAAMRPESFATTSQASANLAPPRRLVGLRIPGTNICDMLVALRQRRGNGRSRWTRFGLPMSRNLCIVCFFANVRTATFLRKRERVHSRNTSALNTSVRLFGQITLSQAF